MTNSKISTSATPATTIVPGDRVTIKAGRAGAGHSFVVSYVAVDDFGRGQVGGKGYGPVWLDAVRVSRKACPNCQSLAHRRCCARCGALVQRNEGDFCTNRCARLQHDENEASAIAEASNPTVQS